jgi:hypothetical protein
MALAVALIVCGCSTAKDPAAPTVRVRAEQDLACSGDKITIDKQIGGRYSVKGCGREAVYDSACEGIDCQVTKAGDEAPAWRDRPDPGSIHDPR